MESGLEGLMAGRSGLEGLMAGPAWRVVRRVLAGSFVAGVAGAQLGVGSYTLQPEGLRVVRFLAWAHVALRAARGSWARAAVGTLALVRFSPRRGLPAIGLFAALVRVVLFGRAGLALPPLIPCDLFFRTFVLKYGPQKRHLAGAEVERRMDAPAVTMLRPLSHTDWRLVVPMIFVNDVAMIEQVMGDKETYPSRGHTGFTSLVGTGLLGLPTGEMWSKHRRLVMRYLTDKHLRGYAGITQRKFAAFSAKWDAAARSGAEVNGYYDLSMLTLDVIMEICLGEELPETCNQATPQEDNEMAADLDWALQDIITRTALPMYDWLPSPRIDKIRARLDAMFDRLVAHAEAKRPEERPEVSILHGLLSATNEDGSRALSSLELNEEFKTIRGAGHETTGNTCCFMIKLLLENPRCLAKLREEVDAKVAGAGPTFDEWKELRYCHQVMYEALRMYPTVPQFPREAACEAKLGPYDVPKGALVFVQQQSLNYSPKVWDAPHEFRPERFENVRDLRPTEPVGVPGNDNLAYGFLPFGAGLRTCAGQRLAMLEGVQIIASICKAFDMQLMVAPDQLDVVSDVTLGPKHGLPLRITRRSVGQAHLP